MVTSFITDVIQSLSKYSKHHHQLSCPVIITTPYTVLLCYLCLFYFFLTLNDCCAATLRNLRLLTQASQCLLLRSHVSCMIKYRILRHQKTHSRHIKTYLDIPNISF